MRADLATDSGMLCLWDRQPFQHITDYDSWDPELCEDADILRHLTAGHLVPLNLGDGAFAVEVRYAAPSCMSDREREYLLVPSQPYFFRSTGCIFVSGIEHIGQDPKPALSLDLAPGGYTIEVSLIDWAVEPGAKDSTGSPTSDALPDMILFIQPVGDILPEYRKSIETFRREDALR